MGSQSPEGKGNKGYHTLLTEYDTLSSVNRRSMAMYRFIVTSFFLPLFAATILSCSRPDPLTNGTLSIALNGSPTNIDPRYATDAYSQQIIELCYNGLMKKDTRGSAVPDLAQKIVFNTSTQISVLLRKGIHFHDGSELTADDVISTYRFLGDPKRGSPYMETFGVIQSMEKKGDYSFSITLTRPFAPFLTSLTIPIVKKGTPEEDLKGRENGTGPFRIISFSPDESVLLSPFRNYFKPAPKIGKIQVKIIPDDNVRFLELAKGEVNFVINGVDPDLLNEVKKLKNLVIEEKGGSNFSYIGFNLEDPILKKKKVREAIARGINRQEIIDKILGGHAREGNTLIAPMYWAHEKNVKGYDYNPALAKQLLDEAGYPDPDGAGKEPRFTLTYKTSQNELRRRIAQVIQGQLGKIGISVTIRSFEWGTFFNDIKSGNFQIYSLTWVGITDPDIYYYAFHSLSVPPSGANRNRYKNPTVDFLLEEGRKELDPAKRKAIYSKVQKIIARDLPIIGLWFNRNILVRDRRIKGFTLSPDESFKTLASSWIEK